MLHIWKQFRSWNLFIESSTEKRWKCSENGLEYEEESYVIELPENWGSSDLLLQGRKRK